MYVYVCIKAQVEVSNSQIFFSTPNFYLGVGGFRSIFEPLNVGRKQPIFGYKLMLLYARADGRFYQHVLTIEELE